jgi:CubicO group peptidase (beta-lactamase class C family)
MIWSRKSTGRPSRTAAKHAGPMRLMMLVSLFWVAVTATGAAQTGAADPRLADFDAYVARAGKDWNAAGLAVAVVKDGKVVFERTYGVREIGKPDPVDTLTLFAIASTTKAITSAALGMLVDEGKVKWDDPVTKYIPSLQLYDPYVTRELTVRDLLTHRAGAGNSDFLWYLNDVPRREIIRRLKFVKPSYSLRSSFEYQNVLYSLAGDVIEAASGISWEQFVTTRIFQPLGMTRTFPTYAIARTHGNIASPHWRKGDTLSVITNSPADAIAAAGSVWSSIADMAKWTRFLLDSAKIGSTRYIKEQTFRELFTPQVSVPLDEFYITATLTRPHWMTYGLGWYQQDYRGRMVNFHTGSLDGMVAIIGLIPEENLGVYVLANADHIEVRHALMLRVFDLFLGDPVRDWSSELKTLYAARNARRDSSENATVAKRIRGTRPSLALEKYSGTYTDFLLGKLVVTAGRGKMRVRTSSLLAGTAEHWQYDTFRIHWDNVAAGTDFVTFTLGEGGVPAQVQFAGFTLRRDGP